MSIAIPWGQYQKAFKEIGDAVRSGIMSPYRGKKITKLEFTYNADKNVETIKAYDNATLLFTLTFSYNIEKTVTSIIRS